MMEKNQKILLGIEILAIVGIVLISGCLNENKTLPLYSKYIPINNTLTPLQICEKISNEQSKYRCFAEINEFDKILDEDLKNYYLAIKNNDVGLCKKVKQQNLKLACYNRLVDEEELINFVNVSICEENQGCYFRFAKITGNISLCDEIINPELIGGKEECYIAVAKKTGNVSICEEKISNKNENNVKDRCFGGVCVKTGDTKYCEKIRSQEFKDIYYSSLADKQNNALYCEQIKDPYHREICTIDIKYSNQSYIEHCDEIINSKLKSLCYYQLGVNKSDSSLCEKVANLRDKDSCYLDIAEKTSNEQLCEKIKNNEKKDFCYFIIATQIDNFDVCDKINNYQCKAGCFGLTKNPKYCNEITSPIKMRGECIINAAERNKDITICESENLPYSPDGCYFDVAINIYKHENNITNNYFGYYNYYDYEMYLCSKNIFNIFND